MAGNRAQIALTAYREACNLIRRDLARALENRFARDRTNVSPASNVISIGGPYASRDRVEQDVAGVLSDHLDWPLDREWRRLMEAFREVA